MNPYGETRYAQDDRFSIVEGLRKAGVRSYRCLRLLFRACRDLQARVINLGPLRDVELNLKYGGDAAQHPIITDERDQFDQLPIAEISPRSIKDWIGYFGTGLHRRCQPKRRLLKGTKARRIDIAASKSCALLVSDTGILGGRDMLDPLVFRQVGICPKQGNQFPDSPRQLEFRELRARPGS
jgi:hypothetical protein